MPTAVNILTKLYLWTVKCYMYDSMVSVYHGNKNKITNGFGLPCPPNIMRVKQTPEVIYGMFLIAIVCKGRVR